MLWKAVQCKGNAMQFYGMEWKQSNVLLCINIMPRNDFLYGMIPVQWLQPLWLIRSILQAVGLCGLLDSGINIYIYNMCIYIYIIYIYISIYIYIINIIYIYMIYIYIHIVFILYIYIIINHINQQQSLRFGDPSAQSTGNPSPFDVLASSHAWRCRTSSSSGTSPDDPLWPLQPSNPQRTTQPFLV